MKCLWICIGLLVAISIDAAETPATVYIISPADGDSLESPVLVQFGLRGLGIAPAGIEHKNSGHHHLLINHDSLPAKGQPLGNNVKHFGGGQTEALLDLPPGKYSLQLIMGDHLHIPLDPLVVSEKITIKVK